MIGASTHAYLAVECGCDPDFVLSDGFGDFVKGDAYVDNRLMGIRGGVSRDCGPLRALASNNCEFAEGRLAYGAVDEGMVCDMMSGWIVTMARKRGGTNRGLRHDGI